LKYGPGDWNALHRDLYGDLVFPLQAVINLTDAGNDYTGGEFLLVEHRPWAQSRGTAVTLPHLQGLVFTTRDRPIATQRGWSAAPVRHGVSTGLSPGAATSAIACSSPTRIRPGKQGTGHVPSACVRPTKDGRNPQQHGAC
jgi:hypothetical protein